MLNAHSLHPIPIEYFAIKFGQEMDLAPVIAMSFMCYKHKGGQVLQNVSFINQILR